MKASALCDRIINSGFYLLFCLIPLLLTPWNYELFEYNKMMAVYAITTVIAGAWVIKILSEGQVKIKRTPLDIPILIFAGSQVLSSLFSIDTHISWFGYYSRFNGGMWSILCYVILYYAFVSNFMPKSDLNAGSLEIKNQSFDYAQDKISKIKNTDKKSNIYIQSTETLIFKILKAAIITASLVAFYGVLERLGIDKHLWVQDVQNRVFSTLGQPNWLAAYLVALIPIAMALTIQNKSLFTSFFYTAVTFLLFLVILFTKSRSGLLGFAVADLAFWGLILYTKTLKLREKTGKTFCILHVIFFLIIFFNGTKIESIDKYITLNALKQRVSKSQTNNPSITLRASLQPTTQIATPSGTLLETGGTESGTIRKYVWQGAVRAWLESPKTILVGSGTETFAFAFYKHKPAGHNLTSEWDFLYNKAHNEYLNYLATTGILGLGSYLLFIGAFIYWFIKSHKFQDINTQILPYALFAGWASILVTNFFGFSVVVTNLFFFLFPALIISNYELRITNYELKIKNEIGRRIYILAVNMCCIIILFLIMRHWYGDTLFASAYRNTRFGKYAESQQLFERTIAVSPREPIYHDEYARLLSDLTINTLDEGNATRAAEFIRKTLFHSDTALIISPKNVNFWKTRTKVFFAFSYFDEQFVEAAINALLQAKALSPNDPKIYYNLAILYGRKDMSHEAIDALLHAKELKANYRDAYYALYVFYYEKGMVEQAKQILNEYLTNVDGSDLDFQDRIQKL